jgi:N-acetylmuramoyl-L-alanine amidase
MSSIMGMAAAAGSRAEKAAQLRAELEARAKAAVREVGGATPSGDAAESKGENVGQGGHEVGPGECIASIARDTGHFWETIWNEPANTELREVRRQPNVLMTGDRVTIPELREKQEPGETLMRHRFRRRGEPSHLKVRVLDHDEPRANQPFKLTVDETLVIEGMTDPEGKIDVPIPGNARKGVLVVGVEPDVETHQMNLGGLDPVESWGGVQARLRNMGFECEITKKQDEQTLEAVNEFRLKHGMPESDEMDDATRRKIQTEHGS